MKKGLIAVTLLFFTATSARADLLGTWAITMQMPTGVSTNNLIIRKDGDAHLASMATPHGEAEIGEIQVDGDHFEFSFSRSMGAGSMTYSYEGDVNGDTMSGKATTPRGSLPFTGTRQ